MADQLHPYAGVPRVFRASAMPQGDRRFGVEGPLVSVREYYGAASSSAAVGQQERSAVRERLWSRAEAAQLRDELNAALRALDVAEMMAEAAERIDIGRLHSEALELEIKTEVIFAERTERPRAFTGPYPIRTGGTIAEVGFEGERQDRAAEARVPVLPDGQSGPFQDDERDW